MLRFTRSSFRLYGRPSMIFCEYASPIPESPSRSALAALLMSILAPPFLASFADSAFDASFDASFDGGGAVFIWASAGAEPVPSANARATRIAISRVTSLLLSASGEFCLPASVRRRGVAPSRRDGTGRHVPTLAARAALVPELGVRLRHGIAAVVRNVLHHLVELRPALLAVPGEAIVLVVATRALQHEHERVGRELRRVGHTGGTVDDLALAHDDDLFLAVRRAVVQVHVAL